MFCPNCGTKNADTEAKCAQCGFDIQAKAPQARFKGTMVMAPAAPAAPAAKPDAPAPGAAAAQTSPGQTPAATKGGASLKGTMIGVAPPEMARAIEEAKAKALAQAAASAQPRPTATSAPQTAAPQPAAKPSLKGTMIGVAPPDMQAAIAAAKAKATSGEGAPRAPAQAAPSAPAAGQTPAATPAPVAKPSMKGTMIGVAPPDMQAAIASHKADLEKRSIDAARTALTDPAPPPTASSSSSSSSLNRAVSSKLKGTMMGVAPPDMQAAIASAKASAAATAATPAAVPKADLPPPAQDRPSAKQDFSATMVGTAAPVAESLRPTTTSSRPPSGEFKGTMVGATSPLVESPEASGAEAHGPDSRAANNSDHPAAFASTSLSSAAEIVAARANLQRVLAESDAPPKVPTGRDIPTGAQSPAAIRSMEHASKRAALPVLLLGLALVLVAVLIGFALLSRAKSTAPDEAKPASGAR